MAYGTGHHGSVAEAKEEKPQVQPGLAGAGSWAGLDRSLQAHLKVTGSRCTSCCRRAESG